MTTPPPDIPPYRPRHDPFGAPGPEDVPVDDQPRHDRSRGGGVFPIPHGSWTTRRGTRVTVGGCCLPLPIGCLATALAVAGAAAAVVSSARRV